MKLIFLTILLLISIYCYSKNIYVVIHKTQADYVVFLVDNEKKADLKIYLTFNEAEAKYNDAIWFLVKSSKDADCKIFFTTNINDADFTMVMIRNKNNVGWNKNKWNKKSLKK
jgi:hypothetical protein